MEPNLINERIMLAKAFPGNTRRKNFDFSSVLEKQLAAKSKPIEKPRIMEIRPQGQEQTSSEKPLVLLGTLSKSRPTVSNILIKDETFGKECWQIIHDKVNQGKPYKAIMAGTKIYINPETKEILWGDMVPDDQSIKKPETQAFAMKSTKNNAPAIADDNFSEKLVDAVKPYLGKDYNDINCYELLVKGLKKMGVKYQGTGGLGHKLIKMAIEKGLPINAYFNGEGLVKASGSNVYSKSIVNVKQPESQALEMINEMKPLLEKGLILSFSTPTKGHTGIISKKDDLWTFINSGDMDNIIGHNKNEKGVGEENLIEEIINWFKLAESRKENLRISIGKLNEEKLSAYNENKGQGLRSV